MIIIDNYYRYASQYVSSELIPNLNIYLLRVNLLNMHNGVGYHVVGRERLFHSLSLMVIIPVFFIVDTLYIVDILTHCGFTFFCFAVAQYYIIVFFFVLQITVHFSM